MVTVWKMTLHEYIEMQLSKPHVGDEMCVRNAKQVHKTRVAMAVKCGEDVPVKVLRDYPEFGGL